MVVKTFAFLSLALCRTSVSSDGTICPAVSNPFARCLNEPHDHDRSILQSWEYE